jgi:hypothetical protein
LASFLIFRWLRSGSSQETGSDLVYHGEKGKKRGTMSFWDYHQSKEIVHFGYSFYDLIMAAMRQADSNNIEKLKAAFPEVYRELLVRYRAPGGKLEGEK